MAANQVRREEMGSPDRISAKMTCMTKPVRRVTTQDHKIRRGANKEENRMLLLSEQTKKSPNGFAA